MARPRWTGTLVSVLVFAGSVLVIGSLFIDRSSMTRFIVTIAGVALVVLAKALGSDRR